MHTNSKVVVLLSCLAAASTSLALEDDGHLSGTDTKDRLLFSAPQGTTINWRVKGSGSGSNKMSFKIQQKKAGGRWTTRVERTLNMPSDSETGNLYVKDYREGSNESLRYVFGRKMGTNAISWYISHSD